MLTTLKEQSGHHPSPIINILPGQPRKSCGFSPLFPPCFPDREGKLIEIYKELLDKQPNDRLKQNLAAASITYGYDLYEKQDYGQAILYFEDAIELNNKEASAYFGYAQANEKMGCIETALVNYEKAVCIFDKCFGHHGRKRNALPGIWK